MFSVSVINAFKIFVNLLTEPCSIIKDISLRDISLLYQW